MNNFGEKYPDGFEPLLEKCDNTITLIENSFSQKNAAVVKDLYNIGLFVSRCKDYYVKLNVQPNVKKSKDAKRNNEVKGLYVFAELDENGIYVPIYVGISRTVFRRLYQHSFGKAHNQASFCYLKAKHLSGHTTARIDLPWQLIEEQQQKLRDYGVLVIPEEHDYDLYFMEVYIAGKLKTKWNSFKTH